MSKLVKVFNENGKTKNFAEFEDIFEHVDNEIDSSELEFIACTTEPGKSGNKNKLFATEKELFNYIKSIKIGYGWGEVHFDNDAIREYHPISE